MIIKTKTPLASTHNIVKLFISIEDMLYKLIQKECMSYYSLKHRLNWAKRYKLAYLVYEKLGTKCSLELHTEPGRYY